MKIKAAMLILAGFVAVSCDLPAEAENQPASTTSSVKTLAPGAFEQEIERLLEGSNPTVDGSRILAEDVIRDIYRENGFTPLWQDISRAEELLDLLEESRNHGLNPKDYFVDKIRSIVASTNLGVDAKSTAREEILLTESLLRYGYHRRLGKVTASKLDPDINFHRSTFRGQAPSVTVRQLLDAPSLRESIRLVAPAGPYYRKLQYWLAKYHALADAGGWPTIPAGATLRKSDTDKRVTAIRKRLAASGDLPKSASQTSEVFDAELVRAVIAFQQRHGLDDDGIVGKQSIAAMNIPVEQRIDQLRTSLERLRWVEQENSDRFVVVNIAGFNAFYFSQGELRWTTRAMVGKTYRKTPVFRGDIRYMEFNPTWTIPPGILRNDTLPAIKRDPNYLASKNIRVIDRNGKYVDPKTVNWNRYSKGVPYTLRQDPGPKNALGTVKFIFPNKHFVFLHDTPHRELFDRPERAFSSGCIRVEDPLRLAELLLADSAKYPRSELEAVVASRKTRRINLEQTVPVIILYLTAEIDQENRVRFMKDIYSRDQKVLDALDGPVMIDLPGR